MSSVISLPSNITVWLGPALAVALAYLASAACREKVQICIDVTCIYSNITTYTKTVWSEPALMKSNGNYCPCTIHIYMQFQVPHDCKINFPTVDTTAAIVELGTVAFHMGVTYFPGKFLY